MIAIATRSVWITNLAPVFKQISKIKANRSMYRRCFPRFLIARKSDWFIVLVHPFLIGLSNYFVIGFSSHLKTALSHLHMIFVMNSLKDGAYYCYCAYVLRIRYSDFLSPMLTNTGIFLRGLKLSGESRSY